MADVSNGHVSRSLVLCVVFYIASPNTLKAHLAISEAVVFKGVG